MRQTIYRKICFIEFYVWRKVYRTPNVAHYNTIKIFHSNLTTTVRAVTAHDSRNYLYEILPAKYHFKYVILSHDEVV